MTIFLYKSQAIVQKSGRLCTARAKLQPVSFKSDKLLGTALTHFAATDPVGGLDHSLPIHPDQERSRPMEYWEEQLRKRNPRKRPPVTSPEKPHDPDHRIDDFA